MRSSVKWSLLWGLNKSVHRKCLQKFGLHSRHPWDCGLGSLLHPISLTTPAFPLSQRRGTKARAAPQTSLTVSSSGSLPMQSSLPRTLLVHFVWWTLVLWPFRSQLVQPPGLMPPMLCCSPAYDKTICLPFFSEQKLSFPREHRESVSRKASGFFSSL